MKNEIFKKTIVIGLIVLFIGAGVTCGADINIEQNDGISEKPLEGNEIFISEPKEGMEPYGQLNAASISIDDPDRGYIYIFRVKIPQLIALLFQLRMALCIGPDLEITTDWSGDIVSVRFEIENQQGTIIREDWDYDSYDGFSMVFGNMEFGFYDMLVEGYDANGNLKASHDVNWLDDWCAVVIPPSG